jgi:UDPglucose 6-dehydrogenase
MKIGWIGLGKCGLPIAEEIAKVSDVIAHDLIFKELENAKFSPDINDLKVTDVIFILVQTPHMNPDLDGSIPINLKDTADYDYTALSACLLSLNNIGYLNPIVISSTVSPGTIRTLSELYPDLTLIYMPVMIHIGTVAKDYVTAPMYFIGNSDGNGSYFVEQVLRNFVSTDKFIHGTWEEVELYKMLGNIYSSIKIAFANTVSEMIEFGKFNASSWNVMDALLNDTVRFNSSAYLTPGSGNGGPCHPRDGVVLSWLTDKIGMKSSLLKDVTKARQDQAYALAQHLISYKLPIIILGKTFKPGVDLTVGSYSVLVGSFCQSFGLDVEYDVSPKEKSVVLLAHRDVRLIDKYNAFSNDSVVVDLWNLNLDGNVKVWGNNRI